MSLKVAVFGASGIGKHHAKWHHHCGGDVVAFLGSTAETCAHTETLLKDLFPFTGRGFTDLCALLEATQPDIVDVCSPNDMHYDHVLAALDAGCHVLCEKPLIWEDQPLQSLRSRASDLVRRAAEVGKILGVCTQYAMSLRQYQDLFLAQRGMQPKASVFSAEMETLARGRVRSAKDVWVDMGPHPLSLLLSWHPGGFVNADSISAHFTDREVYVEFDFETANGTCQAEIAVRDCDGGPPKRRFGVDDFVVDCSGLIDETGVYRSFLSDGMRESVEEDFMSLLIRDFHEAASGVRAQPAVSGETGLRNLELQLQVIHSAEFAS